jgi:ribosome maturation factor RimP
MRKEIADLWNLIEPYARGAGFDLVELSWGREGGGWALRVYIDRPYGPESGNGENDGPRLPHATGTDPLFQTPPVDFEDCERVSRDVSAALDVADAIPHAYVLEVSSPGLERPLRREQDFRRFAGQQVKIRSTEPVEGRRNFSGTLVGAAAGVAEVESEGRTYRVPIELVARANLVPDWAAEFRRSSESQGEGRGQARGGPDRKSERGREPKSDRKRDRDTAHSRRHPSPKPSSSRRAS